jgi:internalin A
LEIKIRIKSKIKKKSALAAGIRRTYSRAMPDFSSLRESPSVWSNVWLAIRRSLRAGLLLLPMIALGAPQGPKLPPQQIVEKLLALGAEVWVKKGTTADMVQVKSAVETFGQKFTFARIEFHAERPDQTPFAAADYALLDSLTDLPELALYGEAVDDTVLEKLRPFHALVDLTVDGPKISKAEYALFPALPELHVLRLRTTGTTDEALKTIVQCRKLKTLELNTQPISDDGLASLSKLTTLEELNLATLEQVGSAGFAHLADCRALKTVYVSGLTVLSGMVENLAHCKNLENLGLPDTVLKDSDIAPLSGLMKLHYLDLSHSSVTGAAFASWPARQQFTTLNLENAGGVDDAICKNIERAFPKLEELTVKLAASGFTPVGAATLARSRSLHLLRLGGPGVTDEAVAQLVRCDGLTTLGIPGAQLSEKGVASLAKLPHLAELNLDVPPLTDAALKSFGRCKELKNLYVGSATPPEADPKLHKVLPDLVIHRPEE